jgi:hypothetical protein
VDPQLSHSAQMPTCSTWLPGASIAVQRVVGAISLATIPIPQLIAFFQRSCDPFTVEGVPYIGARRIARVEPQCDFVMRSKVISHLLESERVPPKAPILDAVAT